MQNEREMGRRSLKYVDGRKPTNAAAARSQSLPLARSGLVQRPLSYESAGLLLSPVRLEFGGFGWSREQSDTNRHDPERRSKLVRRSETLTRAGDCCASQF